MTQKAFFSYCPVAIHILLGQVLKIKSYLTWNTYFYKLIKKATKFGSPNHKRNKNYT